MDTADPSLVAMICLGSFNNEEDNSFKTLSGTPEKKSHLFFLNRLINDSILIIGNYDNVIIQQE